MNATHNHAAPSAHEAQWIGQAAWDKFYAAHAARQEKFEWVSLVEMADQVQTDFNFALKAHLRTGVVVVRPVSSELASKAFRRKYPHMHHVLIVVEQSDTDDDVRRKTYEQLRKVHQRRKNGRKSKKK